MALSGEPYPTETSLRLLHHALVPTHGNNHALLISRVLAEIGRATRRRPGTEVLTVEKVIESLQIGGKLLRDALGQSTIAYRQIERLTRLSRTGLVQWLGSESCEAGKGQ